MKLAQVVDDYVGWKCSLGFRFRTAGNIVKAFARAAGPVDVRDVSQQMVGAFLKGPRPLIRSSWHTKHYTLVGLFRFALQRGLLSTSPLPYFVPKRPEYARPYIYSTDELQQILDGSKILDARNRRSGQAASKLSSALGLYAENRLALLNRAPTVGTFFLRRHGIAISGQVAERYFRMVRSHLGMRRQDGAYFQPRLHDLRHTFAVHRLVAWYRQGADVQLLLPKLSTYLGHIGLAETQHYLTMTPDLLREAGRRFESYAALEAQP